MAFNISVDENLCTGCGACVATGNFEMKDGKSKPIKQQVDEVGNNQKAADFCPGKAISITEV